MSSNVYLRSIQLNCAWPVLAPLRRRSVRLIHTAGAAGKWSLQFRGRLHAVDLRPGCWVRIGSLTILKLGRSRDLPGQLFVWQCHQNPDDWRHFHVLLSAGTMGDA